MTRRAATGALLLALAAFGLALALALPAPLVTSINLEDQGTPVFLPLHREILPTTIPTDLTSEEIEYAKSLFGSDILDSFSNSQPTPILSLQTEANAIYAASTDTNHQKMPSRPSPGFFRWLQQRQEKKALEKQLRTFLENEEKFLVEQMNELQQEITQIQSQWTNNYNLQGRVLQQQTALKEQKEVLRHLEKMPTPYRASYYEPSRWQSTPMLITSSSPGKIVFSMDRPMTVVANQDPSPASQADQAKSPYSPAAPAAPTLTASAATDDVVVTPGVPDSLAQFARSQIAGRV